MKEVLHHPDTVEAHALNFDCDIDRGSEVPAATDQEVPIGCTHVLSTNYDISKYQLPTPLSDRHTKTHGHISSIPFCQLQTHLHIKTWMPREIHGHH